MSIGFNKSFGWVVKRVKHTVESIFDRVIQQLSGGVIVDQKTDITPIPITNNRSVLSTDGKNNFVFLNYYPDFNDVIEIYAKFYDTGSTSKQVHGANNTSIRSIMTFGIYNGKWFSQFGGSSSGGTSGTDADGDWHVFKYVLGALYVDDVLVADDSDIPRSGTNDVEFVIGAAYGDRLKLDIAWFKVNDEVLYNFEECSGDTTYSLDGSGIYGRCIGSTTSREMRYSTECESGNLENGCNAYSVSNGSSDLIELSTIMDNQVDVSNVTMEFTGFLDDDDSVFIGENSSNWVGFQKSTAGLFSNNSGSAEFSIDGSTWFNSSSDFYDNVRTARLNPITIRNISFVAYTKLFLFGTPSNGLHLDGRTRTIKIDWNSSGVWDTILKPFNHGLIDTLSGKFYYNYISGKQLETLYVPALREKTISVLTMNGSTDELLVTGLIAGDTVICDGSSTPTANTDKITFTAGTVYNITINGELTYACTDVLGTITPTLMDLSGFGSNGILVGSLTDIWKVRIPSVSGIIVDAEYQLINNSNDCLHNGCEVGIVQQGTQLLHHIESPEGDLEYQSNVNNKPSYGES